MQWLTRTKYISNKTGDGRFGAGRARQQEHWQGVQAPAAGGRRCVVDVLVFVMG